MNLVDVLADLNSYDDLIRRAAHQTLLDLGPEAVPILLEEFPTIGGVARLSVLRVLGEIGDERAVPLLLEAMCERSPDSYFLVPSLAARALGQIGGRMAVEGLRGHLEHDDRGVRRMAAAVLRHIGDELAIDALRWALAHHSAEVRGLAADALRRIGTPHTYAILASAGYRL